MVNQAEDIKLVDDFQDAITAYMTYGTLARRDQMDEKRIALLTALGDLREIEWMYKDLCK